MINKFANSAIARLLRQVSAAYTIKGMNRFRIIAYDKAAETIEKSNIDVKDLWEDERLSELPGIGQTITSHLDEYFKTGQAQQFTQAFKNLPAGMFTLLDVPGFGPKKAYKLAKIFKLNHANSAIDNLLKVAKADRIAPLEGFGEKSQIDIIEALESFKKGQFKQKRMSLPYAYTTAMQIVDYLLKSPETIQASPLGSLRRQVSTIGDIDIAVATNNPQKSIDWFINYPKKVKVTEKGPTGATILLESGQQIDLRVQNPDSFGAMLQYFTGSKQHNIRLRELALKKGLSLSEYGIKQIRKTKGTALNSKNYNKKKNIYEFKNEGDFYKVLGLPFIPPELREGWGEIDASLKGKLPKLISLKDIKGEVHIHSNYNLEPSHDLGQSSLEELLIEGQSLSYQYLGISDHNPSYTNHSAKQISSIMKRRKDLFEQIISSNKNIRVKLFIMLEVDILSDGNLALPDEAFDYVDAVVVSIHSSFNMAKENMTKRILNGLSHPKAKILAHPTGRLIGSREGYEVDWQKLFDFCKKENKAIEINAYPDRLDLPDIMVKRAIGNGNKLVIDTDSHEKSQLKLMKYGIAVARRGWAEPSDILNTLRYDKFKEWLTG